MFNFFKKKKASNPQQNLSATQRLIHLYQRESYATIPYVENDNSAQFVLDNLNMAVLVPKEYMEPVVSSPVPLLRGDIVALWWLDNPRTKKDRKPKYFAETYGVNLEDSIKRLYLADLIDKKGKLTNKGNKLLSVNDQLVLEHRATKSWSGTGPVEYNFERVLKGEALKNEMIRNRKKRYAESIKRCIESGQPYVEWDASNDSCSKCLEYAEHKEPGIKEKGVFKLEKVPRIPEDTHYDCQCSIFPHYEKDYLDKELKKLGF